MTTTSRQVDDATERQPLLHSSPLPSGEVTPLPRVQLALLFFIRTTDPICFFVIYPFINDMLLRYGNDATPETVENRAGLVEALFALAQLCTIFYWGALSDRIGRKPVLLMGCVASCVSAIMFGFSTNLTMIIVSRCLNGLMNGNIAVLKSTLAELTDMTNQTRAVRFFPICLNLGIIIASTIGGNLVVTPGSELARAIPQLLQFPYLPPMLVAATFPVFSGLSALFFNKETLPPKPTLLRTGQDGSEVHTARSSRRSLREVYSTRVGILLVTYFIQQVIAVSVGCLMPLFYFTPIESGGLGLDSTHIGYLISIRSAIILSVSAFGFPLIAKLMGLVRLQTVSMWLWVISIGLLPLANKAARGVSTALVWASLGVFMWVNALANLCSKLLGALNGLSQIIGTAAGVFGPGSANALFALSVSRQILGGDGIWVVMALVATIGAVVSSFTGHE